jgi:uncharacterized protein
LAGLLLASFLPQSGGVLKGWKKFIKRILLSVLGLALALSIWGVLIEPRLIDVEQEKAALPHLPPACEGRRVALIADLQVGMWLGNTDIVRRIVARLIEEEPKEVRGTLLEINRADALVAPLPAAGIPTSAALGNHDYAMGQPDDVKLECAARRVSRSLESASVRMLENQAATLTLSGAENSGDQPLYIVGVGSHFADNDCSEAALAQVPPETPRIVFIHNPASFAEIPAGAAPLALAAHTHGGQVRLPFMPEGSIIVGLRWSGLTSYNASNLTTYKAHTRHFSVIWTVS